jgi:ATP synthase protein I
MPDGRRRPRNRSESEGDDFRRTVGSKEARKARARRRGERQPWFWLGMFGLVGWSVATPTIIGAALGLWLDRRYPGGISWTLTGLILGAAAGCWGAWHWVRKESEER